MKLKDFQFKYTKAANENPVGNAVLANLRGKFAKPEKPKVRFLVSIG